MARRHIALALAGWLLTAATAWADPFTYLSREAWNASVGAQDIDDFTAGGYSTGDVYNDASFDVHTDANMSAVRGQTRFRGTAYADRSIVFGNSYCSGCNGSFELAFDGTSLTTGGGVYGVGLVFEFGDSGGRFNGFTAFTTLADGATYNIQTPATNGFIGFTSSTAPIQSIHFGRPNGQPDFFAPSRILELAIAAAPATDLTAVPEPGTLLLIGGGLALVAALRARRR